MKVSELKTEMDGKFTAVDERITAEGEKVRRYVDERVAAEGETTRRHFDVVAEKMMSGRNLSLDRSMATAQQLAGLTASNADDHVRLERRLDDHERRIDTIERGRATDPV